MKNEILEKRIAQLIAQTFAVPVEWTLEESRKTGIETLIEQLENQNTPKFN